MTSLLTEPRPASSDAMQQLVVELRQLAVRAMARMYRPEHRIFAFRVRRNSAASSAPRTRETADAADLIQEGISRRYTAIALIGLADHPPDSAVRVLRGSTAAEACRRLLEDVGSWDNLGDVALALWAAKRLDPSAAKAAYRQLCALNPVHGRHPTVDLSWALTALCQGRGSGAEETAWAKEVADRLMNNFRPASGLFPHWPDGTHRSWLRAHVCCFADIVYPLQALSYYVKRTQDPRAADIARACAERMCANQGPEGQWWWHFDLRTGSVIERYPVYAVHQSSMAPMSFFALQDACGADHTPAIRRGLLWLLHAPEIDGSLIDRQVDCIWRKVARHEPGKLARGLQALASRLHPGWRVPGLGGVFRAGWIDHESRPYHMGWILHAWPPTRTLSRA